MLLKRMARGLDASGSALVIFARAPFEREAVNSLDIKVVPTGCPENSMEVMKRDDNRPGRKEDGQG